MLQKEDQVDPRSQRSLVIIKDIKSKARKQFNAVEKIAIAIGILKGGHCQKPIF